MILEFECKTCLQVFENEMGDVSFETDPPTFQRNPNCPLCGQKEIEEVLLTEIGQGQLTKVFMGFEY